MDEITIEITPIDNGLSFSISGCPSNDLAADLCESIKDALDEQMKEDAESNN